MRSPRLLAAALAAVTLGALHGGGCQSRPSEDETPYAWLESVLELTIRATPAGLSVTGARRIDGTRTKGVILSRPLLVTARDRRGHIVGRVSLDNPRILRTTGTQDHDETVLESAEVRVRFADPERRIRRVDYEVRAGPNAGFAGSCDVRHELHLLGH